MDSTVANEKLIERNRKGLQAVIKILEQWGMDHQSQAKILGIDSGQLNKLASLECLDDQQLTTISYLLNIHASMRELFQNPENQYGYMKSINHNPPFNGKTPLSYIRLGEPQALTNVFQHLEHVKNGQ